MNHFLLGISLPFGVFAVVYLAGKCRASFRMLVVFPLLMLFFGLWAVAPDIPRAFRMNRLYDRLANEPRTDIFLWHYRIDQVETDSPLYAALAIAIIALLMFAAWRELRMLEGDSGG